MRHSALPGHSTNLLDSRVLTSEPYASWRQTRRRSALLRSAIDDICTHRGGPLSEGELNGNQVTCPWHGAVFDVTTGQVSRLPAPKAVSRYNIRIEGGDIEVEI